MLLIALGFALQFPPVQNGLADTAARMLSKAWGAEVSVGHVQFSFFDRITLSRVYLSDQQGDTLLYVGALEAGLSGGPWSWVGGQLAFDELSLSEACLALRRREGAPDLNVQFLIDYFASSEPKQGDAPSSFRLDIRRLHLRHIRFLLDDQPSGKRIEGFLQEGIAHIGAFDAAKQHLWVRRLALDGVQLVIAEYGQRLALEESSPELPPADTAGAKPLCMGVDQFLLQNSRFRLDRFDTSPMRHALEGVIDFQHLDVSDIAVEADSVRASSDLVFEGQLRRLQAREQSGFAIKHFSAQRVYVSDTLTALYGMRLQTNGSELADTIRLRYNRYRDYERFTDGVYLEGRLAQGARIRLGDLIFFSPDLKATPFFEHNRELSAEISGLLYGRVNRLNGRQLLIRVGKELVLRGDFDGDDLAEGSDRLRLLFNLEQAETDLYTLRRILPGFSPPAYFNTLGKVRFRGFYHLLFGTNHILAGDLTSDIGYGQVDMKLDLGGGQERAVYSGFLYMHDFDLATWMNDDQFGLASFRFNIAEGTGLTLATLRARASGTIDSLYYRGYNYYNIELDGSFEQAVFRGRAAMDDPNIAFSFDGTVSFKDASTPEFDFRADVHHLNLRQLNLVERNWTLSGRVHQMKIFAPDWANLYGAVVLRNLHLREGKQSYRVDSLLLAASTAPDGKRRFILRSEVVDGSLQGHFTLDRLGRHIWLMLQRHYPTLAHQTLEKWLPDTVAFNDRYQGKLRIKNTRNLLSLIDPKLSPLKDVEVDVRIDASKGLLDARLFAPHVRYGEAQAYQPEIVLRLNRDVGRIKADLLWAELSPTRPLGHFSLEGDFSRDRIDFLFSAEDTTSVVERLFLKGELSVVDSMWNVHFNTASLTLFDEQWSLEEDNYIRFRPGYWEAYNIYLVHDLKRVLLESYNDGRGLRFSLANFDLSFFDRFLKLEGFAYRGNIFNFDGEIEDIFEQKNLQVYITTDTVFLQEEPMGVLSGYAEMAHLRAPILGRLYLKDRQKHEMRVAMGFLPNAEVPAYVDSELGEIRPGEFEASVSARALPLRILEWFVPDISQTAGSLDVRANLGGALDHIRLNGEAWLDGQFRLDYLGTHFRLPRERILLSSDRIWAEGDTLLDATGKNAAIVRGGLLHDHLRQWRVDCRIQTISPNFWVLNTQPSDNDLFYGQAFGRFDAAFSGSFDQMDMRISATTGRDTRLYIPAGANGTDVQDIDFITFQSSRTDSTLQDSADASKRFRLPSSGLSLEMNLTLTEEAEVQIIFDAQAGDIIKGRGAGNIRMVISREGDFNMYGSYRIVQGDYLFTLLNWVNKPFTIQEGGTITWYGDPFGAQIQLRATYTESTTLFNLLQTELGALPEMASNARRPTKVVAIMYLQGDLFKPDIRFDLAFPDISGAFKSIVDTKLTLLRQEPEEMMRQVFGLVVLGAFIPSSSVGISAQPVDGYVPSAFSTLTQMLSTQLSKYLNDLASEWVGGTLSRMEFDIIYNEYRNQPTGPYSDLGREVQVRLTSGFKDDKVTVQIGSQFGLTHPTTNAPDAFFGGDIVVEMRITENRNWLVRAYARTEPGLTAGSRRMRMGVGMVFRKEFKTFGEMMEGLRGWVREQKTTS